MAPQSSRYMLFATGFAVFQVILVYTGISMYDEMSDDWFMDMFLTPSVAAFPRRCIPALDPLNSDDLDARRSRPMCMKKWVEYDMKYNPSTSGARLNEFAPRFKAIAEQFENNTSANLEDRCKALPNSVFVPYKIDIHFPIFSEHFTGFFSLALLAYDILSEQYRKCGYSLEHILFEEKDSWQFWRAPPEKHEWVTDLVHIIENKWKTQIVAPTSCASLSRSAMNAKTTAFEQGISSSIKSSIDAATNSNSVTLSNSGRKESNNGGPYRVPTDAGWIRYDRKWFHHASDALYLSSLVLREDPCRYQGAASTLLSRPLSFLILNRKNDRKLVNIDEIVAAINSVSGAAVDSQKDPPSAPFKAYPKIEGITNPDTASEHPNVFLFEGASLETQTRTLSQTDIVIVPHGAAETNLAWLKPCSIVLEVFSWAFYDPCYVGLCNSVGLVHHWWQEPKKHTVQTYSKIGAITVCNSQVEDTATRIAADWDKYKTRQPDRLIPSSGNQSLFDSFVTEECMRDGDCRTCCRGALEVTVSIPYMKHILKQAIVDRHKCIASHPFYSDTSKV